jgi:hypothetical protein
LNRTPFACHEGLPIRAAERVTFRASAALTLADE